jgi:hypothetical protein
VSTTEHATLLCGSCRENASHELAYAGRLLVYARCENCGHTAERDVSKRYLKDLELRIRTKPRRMLHRLRRHPLPFTLSLPKQIAAKPLRMWEEASLVLHHRTRHVRKSWREWVRSHR